MGLTAKQERFCQAIADGKTQADAYRAVYNAQKMTDKSVWEKASELMKNGKVASRVDELREVLAEKALWTREDSVRALKKLTGEDTPAAAQVSAVKELNAMHGYLAPSRHDHTSSDGSMTPKTEINLGALSDKELKDLERLTDKARDSAGVGEA